jgi:spore germination protein KA
LIKIISKKLPINKAIKTTKFIESKVDKNIHQNKIMLDDLIGSSDDVIIRKFEVENKMFMVCYIKGMANVKMIDEEIISAIMDPLNKLKEINPENLYQIVKDSIICVSDLKDVEAMDEVALAILSGESALFINGFETAIVINTKGFEARSVEEPQTETVVRGPREGFTENILVNTALIRRRLKSRELVFEKMILGKQTNTTIVIAYINNIANPKVVEEVKLRLTRIKDHIDAILESGYIEQYIEDNPRSIFPTIGNSERPDAVAGKLLEGKVAIVCDCTPFVLMVPYLFIENIQHSEDYYIGPYIATCFRLIRLLAYIITISLPALYIAVTVFHYEMIPTILFITMAAAREGIPLPSSAEAFFIVIIFEIIRETGTRMPKPVGQAISIVGALVLGQAAVDAGIVSSPMIIVVAITGITTFINPSLVNTSFILRAFFMILATGLGLYGILIGFFFVLAHMCSLRSFGVPFFTPIAPMVFKELKDSIIRLPLWSMTTRPESIAQGGNSKRQATDLKPGPPKERKKGKK